MKRTASGPPAGAAAAEAKNPKVRTTTTAAWSTRGLESFDWLGLLGAGMFGNVYEAEDKETGKKVALKGFKLEVSRGGFPLTALREIEVRALCCAPPGAAVPADHPSPPPPPQILKAAQHENVVGMSEVLTGPPVEADAAKKAAMTASQRAREFPSDARLGYVYMVLEYCEHDLTGLLDAKLVTRAHVNHFARQLLTGVGHLHAIGILHRDIKPSNVLVSKRGTVKIADFGFARRFDHEASAAAALAAAAARAASRCPRAEGLRLAPEPARKVVSSPWSLRSSLCAAPVPGGVLVPGGEPPPFGASGAAWPGGGGGAAKAAEGSRCLATCRATSAARAALFLPPRPLTNAVFRSSLAVGRLAGSLTRHSETKATNSFENLPCSTGGGFFGTKKRTRIGWMPAYLGRGEAG